MKIRPIQLWAPVLATSLAFGAAQEPIHPQVVQTPEAGNSTAKVLPALPPGALLDARPGLLFDEPGDGLLWVRGRTYKASFGADGFTYIPFLGGDSPRNFPLRMELESVALAAGSLGLIPASTAQRTGHSVTLDHGMVREVYHLEETSLEQTFVFDNLPERGELVLRMAVHTELQARVAQAGGWAFENERGAVNYGSATVLDATGASLSLEQHLVDGHLEIVVPAGFVQGAVLPLVVDPVISTTTVVNDADNQIGVDIAYDPQNDLYMIVYEESISLFDHDVFSAYFDPNLGIITSTASVDITSARWDDPRVANCYQDETFLTVASVGAVLGSRQVWGRTRSATTGGSGAQFVIGGGFSDDALPDVGGYGNDFASPSDFLVVFQRSNPTLTDSAIVAQAVTASGTLTGPVVNIANVAGQLDQNPSISQTSGSIDLLAAEHQYMVVWEREESLTNHDIWSRVVDFTGDISGHPRFRSYSFSDALDPDVSAQATNPEISPDPYYVIVFERLLGSDYDIFAVVADDGDGDNARNVTAMQDVVMQDEQADPRIAYEGGDYLVVYNTEAPGGGLDAYMTALNVVSDGNELRTGLAERRNALRSLDGSVRDLAITSDFFDAGSTAFTAGMAIWAANGTFGSDGDVGIAEVNEVTSKVIGSQYCEANVNSSGSSAWIRASGSNQSTTTAVTLQASDLPTNQFALMLTSMGNGVTSNPGGSAGNLCLSGAIGRYTSLVGSTGNSGNFGVTISALSLAQPNGFVAAMSGETWYFQCWSRDFIAGAPTSNFSNGIGVSFL